MIHDNTSGVAPTPDPPGPVQLTREGLERLRAQLVALRTECRPEAVRQLRHAKLFLPASANSFPIALAQQGLEFIDAEIARLDAQLATAQVIGDGPAPSTVQLGSRVTLRYEDGTQESVTIVGPLEADPTRNYISTESPAGQALLGKAVDNPIQVGQGPDAVQITIVSIGNAESAPAPTGGT